MVQTGRTGSISEPKHKTDPVVDVEVSCTHLGKELVLIHFPTSFNSNVKLVRLDLFSTSKSFFTA